MDISANDTEEKIQQIIYANLEKIGYSQIKELGSGAFGTVIRVKTKEGFQRAIKIQYCAKDQDDVEFKLGRLLFYEGIENLYGNTV